MWKALRPEKEAGGRRRASEGSTVAWFIGQSILIIAAAHVTVARFGRHHGFQDARGLDRVARLHEQHGPLVLLDQLHACVNTPRPANYSADLQPRHDQRRPRGQRHSPMSPSVEAS